MDARKKPPVDAPADALIIRAANKSDAAALNAIYNHYIENTIITFDTAPWDLARRERWLAQFNPAQNPYYILVAEANRRVVGFAYNSQFRGKAAYQHSTETTIYLAPDACGGGIGARLYQELFARLTATDLHRAYAAIALPNPQSIAFHQRFGFAQIGTLTEVGYKFDRYIDTVWMEKGL